MSKYRCPKDNSLLLPTQTRFGKRWDCPVHGCTVMCWDGQTSTPADQETRQARIEAHALFDALPMRKAQRYKWLQDQMQLEPKDAHIGMFTLEQCQALIERIKDNYE